MNPIKQFQLIHSINYYLSIIFYSFVLVVSARFWKLAARSWFDVLKFFIFSSHGREFIVYVVVVAVAVVVYYYMVFCRGRGRQRDVSVRPSAPAVVYCSIVEKNKRTNIENKIIIIMKKGSGHYYRIYSCIHTIIMYVTCVRVHFLSYAKTTSCFRSIG